MYYEEPEFQLKRRSLAILQDEVRKVTEAIREMIECYKTVRSGKKDEAKCNLRKIRVLEEEVEALRRNLTRNMVEVGTMILSKEDFLKASYSIDDMTGYISSIAFRLSNVNPKALKSNSLGDDIGKLLDKVAEMVQKLNESIFTLSVNPSKAIEIASAIQDMEKDVDLSYRELSARVIKKLGPLRDVMMISDVLERIENLADKCQEASDAVTILALSI